MRKSVLLSACIFAGVSVSFCQTYITNVTIADVEKQKLIPNQTVIINNDLITKIQPAKSKLPEGGKIIDGTGKFLIPGLIDAHIHFFQNGGLYSRPDAINLTNLQPYAKEVELAHNTVSDKLKRYLRNGITTVIDVGASYAYLKQRVAFKDSAFAPAIFMTGPLATTYEPAIYKGLDDNAPFNIVRNIEDGINMVKNQLPYKPDFIKIWYIAGADGLGKEESARKNLPIIKAVIEEAHKNKLKVAVHATERITAQLAVENGADFLVHSIDDELIKDDFVQLIKKNKTILCPTLIVSDGYDNTFGQLFKPTRHDILHAEPFQLGSLFDLQHIKDTALTNRYKNRVLDPASAASGKKAFETSLINLKKLSDAGVIIATGTDAGNIGTLHASSYLGELKAMKLSGMSNWQILQASTINGARVLTKENEFGSITGGKKANLVLLDANPIDSLENITRINRVINRGVVFLPESIISETPAQLVQRQLNAYNSRNIEAFLDTYSDDVELYDFPDKLIGKGKDSMRVNYAGMFTNLEDLHCEIIGRIVQGNTIIDHERVRMRGKFFEAVAVYQVENGKIKKVRFIQ